MMPYVLGEEESVLGFALIGIAGYAPADREDAQREFIAVCERPGQVLLLITEVVAAWIDAEIRNAVLKGMTVQVIPGVHAVAERREDAAALLLSALGLKL
jgi:vacuolar-type H+-ATPase subunit F/Vma7